jgi:hypothetical protein
MEKKYAIIEKLLQKIKRYTGKYSWKLSILLPRIKKKIIA